MKRNFTDGDHRAAGSRRNARRQLINYRTDGGVAVIEMNDPPANTYTYEMNRQLDDAILKARMDNDVYVHRADRRGRQILLGGREHQHAHQRRSDLQVLLLPARERDAAAAGAHAEAGDCGA